MPQKSKTTWLLVADGAEAQVYIITFVPLHLQKLEGEHFKRKRGHVHDLESGRPGHQRQEDHFTAQVAERINAAARRNEFGKLVIAAPPRALAELRKDLSPEVHGLVALEVSAEWTKLLTHDLLEHVRQHMAVPAED